MKKHLLLLIALFAASRTSAQPITKPFLLGKTNYAADTSFIKVPRAYTGKEAIYLKKAAFKSFLKMRSAAAAAGIKLDIVSAGRNFDYQNGIWNRKWEALNRNKPKLTARDKVLDILQWSSMPGTSRHHWGTDMDLNSISPAYFNNAQGQKIYAWLLANAAQFGFGQPFTAGRSTGYKEEKWHWSYLPLARVYLAEYVKQIAYTDLSGVRGSEVAPQIGIIKNWVLAVNPQCK